MALRLAQLLAVSLATVGGAAAASHFARPELSECRDMIVVEVAAACEMPTTEPAVVAASAVAAGLAAGTATEAAGRFRSS